MISLYTVVGTNHGAAVLTAIGRTTGAKATISTHLQYQATRVLRPYMNALTNSRRPVRRLPRIFFLLSLALILTACQSTGSTPVTASKPGRNYQRVAWEHKQPGCKGDQCPLVNIDTLRFLQEPALNEIISQQLLVLASKTYSPLQPSLVNYEQYFLSTAQPGWQSYLQAKVREQDNCLILIELSSYLATGPNQRGKPGRGFINYERATQQNLTLEDVVNPGMTAAFWEKARQAHQRWLIKQKLDTDQGFIKRWPFQPTTNFGFGQKAVYLKYDVETLAPYDMGHIELQIPYQNLKGIFKPQYLRSGA